MVKITPLVASILLSMVAAQDQAPPPTGTDFAFPTGTDAIPFPTGTGGGFGGGFGGPDGRHHSGVPSGFPSGFPTGGFGGEGFGGHHSGGGPRPTGGFGAFGGERPTGGKSLDKHSATDVPMLITIPGFGGEEGPQPTGAFPGGDESGAPAGPQP